MTPLHNATFVDYASEQGFSAIIEYLDTFKTFRADEINYIGTFLISCLSQTATKILCTNTIQKLTR